MDTNTINEPGAVVEVREGTRLSDSWGGADQPGYAAACTVCGWHGYWWPGRTDAEDDAETHECQDRASAETEPMA